MKATTHTIILVLGMELRTTSFFWSSLVCTGARIDFEQTNDKAPSAGCVDGRRLQMRQVWQLMHPMHPTYDSVEVKQGVLKRRFR